MDTRSKLNQVRALISEATRLREEGNLVAAAQEAQRAQQLLRMVRKEQNNTSFEDYWRKSTMVYVVPAGQTLHIQKVTFNRREKWDF